MKENAYYRYIGEHSQRQGHQRVQSGHDQTELHQVGRGEGKRWEREETQVQQPGGQGTKWVTEMVGLCRELQPSLWAQEFRVEGVLCQPCPVTSRNRESLVSGLL